MSDSKGTPLEGDLDKVTNQETVRTNSISSPDLKADKTETYENGLSESVARMSIDGKADGTPKLSREERYAAQVEADSRSIFVGNITPDITPEIIDEHFKDCGLIKRITLLYDKNTGAPKGYAYVEFEDSEAQEKALGHNGSDLKDNKINVYRKRTNLPGYRRQFNFQRPNYYFQQQYYYYPQGGYQDMSMYASHFALQSSGSTHFGHLNGHYRGSPRGNYRSNRRRTNPQRTQFNDSRSLDHTTNGAGKTTTFERDSEANLESLNNQEEASNEIK